MGRSGARPAGREPARCVRCASCARLRLPPPLPCRKLLVDEGEGLPLRLPSMGGRDAFSRGAEADEVLGGGGDAAAVGLLEPALLPFAR